MEEQSTLMQLLTALAEDRAQIWKIQGEIIDLERKIAESRLGRQLAATKEILHTVTSTAEKTRSLIEEEALRLADGKFVVLNEWVRVNEKTAINYDESQVAAFALENNRQWVNVDLRKRDFERDLRRVLALAEAQRQQFTDVLSLVHVGTVPMVLVASNLSALLDKSGDS